MRTLPTTAASGEEIPPPIVATPGGRHTDSFRLARSFVFLLLVTAVDVTNALDLTSRIKYLILLVPLGTLLIIRVRPGREALRRPASSDRILLVLTIVGIAGTLYGVIFRNTQSPSATLFLPMLLAFLYLGTTEPMREDEARSLLRGLLLVGLVYVGLSAVVNSGAVASLLRYRQYRNATMFFIPLGFAAALGAQARLRTTVVLLLAAVTFVAYPSGTAALIVLTTAVTLLVTRPSGRMLRPWMVVAAMVLALVFVVMNFNAAVNVTGSYFSLVGKRNNDVTRVALWHGALARFDESPLVGNLFTGDTTIEVNVPVGGSPRGRPFQAPFHSDYLLLLVNGGLIGLSLLLAWAIAVEVMAYRRYRRLLAAGFTAKAALVRALLIGFNAYLCAMAFNPLFNGMSVAASLFAMYGLMMLVGDPRREPGPDAPRYVSLPSSFEPITVAANGGPRATPARPELEVLRRSIWASQPDEGATRTVAQRPAAAVGAPRDSPILAPEPTAAGASSSVPFPSFASARSRLAGGSRWLFLARLATLVLGFAINALLARLLSPKDVGLYFTTYTLVVIGSTVAELGMDRAVVRFVAAHIGRGEPGRARDAIVKAFLVGSVGTVTLGAILVLSGGHWLPGHVFRSGAIDGVLLLAVGWLIGTALMQLSTESLRGLQRFGLTSLFDWLLVDIITATVFGVAWVQGVRLTYGRVVLVSAVATGVAAVVGLVVVARKTRALRGDGRQPIGEMLSVTWPLFVTNLGLFMVNAGVDIWILGAHRPQPEVALYGAAARIALLVAVPFTILLGTVPPLVAELHARGRRGELERMLRIMATVTTLPAIVACLVFIAFGGPIMGHFYGPFYARGATVLAILSLSLLVSVGLGACGVTLMMTGHQRTMMLVTVVTGSLSVTAAVILAPRFGGTGVAAATACGVLVQNVLQLLFVRRYLGIWTIARASIRPAYQFFGMTRVQREARRT